MIKALYFLALGCVCAWLTELPLGGWWLILGLIAFTHSIFISHRPFRDSWFFGLGYFTNSLWWLYISLHDIGGMIAPLAVFAVIALSAYLALFTASSVAIAYRFNTPITRVLALSSTWTLSEWLRGYLFTGFPWAGIAESQINGPFYSIAPILGGLACTFVVILLAGFISQTKTSWFKKIAATACSIFAAHVLSFLSYTTPLGEPIQVELIQGNFPQSLKFEPEYIKRQIDFYIGAISQSKAELVITPETALPTNESQLRHYQLNNLAHNKYIITGLIGEPTNIQFSNSALGLSPDSSYYRYDKSHLVPFGEFTPWGFQWFVNAMHVPLGNFHRGNPNQKPFSIQQVKTQVPINAGIMICYEDAFGGELAKRQSITSHNLWINLTNLAWFGDGQASKQQLRLAQLRSLETGIPTIRATNTGITSVINQKGQVIAQLPEFKQNSLRTEVQAYKGETPYVKWQNTPILVFCILLFIGIWYSNKKSA